VDLRGYVASLAAASRRHQSLSLGVSPRGAIALLRAAQALAVLNGRDYVLPDDVRAMAPAVLCHRLILSPEAKMKRISSSQILSDILSSVAVPQGKA
jgi:MoxR-like ATPase